LFWATLGTLMVAGAGDILFANLASGVVRNDQELIQGFIEQADLSARLRDDETMAGRRDCFVGKVWRVYAYQLCLVGNAAGVSAENTIFYVRYWPPRPFLSFVSQMYYFTESYGAETVARVPIPKQENL
jgi:hypothetical protein